MRFFLVFLLAAFVVGAVAPGRVLHKRPMILLGLCVAAGAMFYSLRVVWS